MVTPIYGRVQPPLRVLIEDKVEFIAESRVRFVDLNARNRQGCRVGKGHERRA